MRRPSIVKAITAGIHNANRTYEHWSDDMWLDDAGAENLLSIKIAEAITRRKNALNLQKGEFLRLETPFSVIEKYTYAQRKRGSKALIIQGSQQRVDLTLWHKNRTIAVILEVKRRWDKHTCGRDLERLASLIQNYGKPRSGSLKFGALAVFVVARNDKAIEKKYEQIRIFCKSLKFNDIGPLILDELPQKSFGSLQERKDPDNMWWASWTCGGVVITLLAK